MAPSIVCPVCSKSVPDIEDHINESHSNPDKRVDDVSEAEYIRKVFSGEIKTVSYVPTEEPTTIPVFDPLADLGVKLDDFKTARVSTETGASLTASEAKRMLESIENLVGFRYSRPAFIANLLDWGIRNGFTEELAEAGGFYIVSEATQAHREEYYRVDQLAAHVSEDFSRTTGRSFTFRRFGRFLGPKIPSIVSTNESLRRFYTEGSPMSNRLGIKPQLFLTATSIFEYIKPFSKWTSDEKAAWEAHNRSVTKVANSQDSGFLPADLRPSPSQAASLASDHYNDFGKRAGLGYQDYGKGANIFQSSPTWARMSTRNPDVHTDGSEYRRSG